MLSTAQIEIKLRKKAEEFNECFSSKNYAKAKNIFDTAQRVALFIEADRELMWELFGDNPSDDAKEPLFDAEKARKCYLEVAVKGNGGFENKKYQSVRERRVCE